MRKLSLALAACVAMAGLSLPAHAQEKIKLKHAAWEPPSSFLVSQVYRPWIADIEKASGGALEIEVFAGGTLGGPAAQLQNIEGGVADVGLVVPSQTPGRFPLNEVGELPFLWSDVRQASVAVNRLVEQGELKYPGVKILAAFTTGHYQLHSKKPMTKMSDLRGQKIRVAGPVFGKVAAALGASPVGMLTNQVAEAISRGALDGTIQDWSILHTFRISEVTPHHFEYPLGGVIVLMAMNQAKYDSLPPQVKKAIDQHSGRPLSLRWANAVETETERVKDVLRKTPGHVIVAPNAAETKKIDKALGDVVDQWGAESKEKGAVLAAFKKELAAAKGAK